MLFVVAVYIDRHPRDRNDPGVDREVVIGPDSHEACGVWTKQNPWPGVQAIEQANHGDSTMFSAEGLKVRAAMIQEVTSGNPVPVPSSGGVTLTGAVAVATAASGDNTVIVTKTGTQTNVNFNGADNLFTDISEVFFNGSVATGTVTFTNTTSLVSVAYGGSGQNTFQAGDGMNEFIGGSGSNTFIAGVGYDVLCGGSGPNTYNLNAAGSGVVFRVGSSNQVNGVTANYRVY